MAKKADDLLSRITPSGVDISDFTSSTVEETLKSPRGVLALGQMIVEHLDLPAAARCSRGGWHTTWRTPSGKSAKKVELREPRGRNVSPTVCEG